MGDLQIDWFVGDISTLQTEKHTNINLTQALRLAAKAIMEHNNVQITWTVQK